MGSENDCPPSRGEIFLKEGEQREENGFLFNERVRKKTRRNQNGYMFINSAVDSIQYGR